MTNKILIAGATGLVGHAAVEHFAALPGWDVVGTARRIPEIEGKAELVSVDLTDRAACEAAFGAMSDVTHLIYAALFEKPGLIAGWRERDQMETNLAMLTNLFEPLEAAASGLKHVSLLQGTKAYGAHVRPIKVPARERWPRDDHENFYWLQEDFLRDRQPSKDWSWTVFRPQIVFGHALGSPMNFIAALGVYGAVMREEGKKLVFPGGPPFTVEAVDARLLARCFEWAATTPECANEIFNNTNGDVFCWPYVWPVIAECLGMEEGEPAPMNLREEMPKKSAVWDGVVAKYGLRPNSMQELVGDSFWYADFGWATGRDRPPPPALVSTIKARQFGFHDCMDTEDMFRYWFKKLQDMKVLPPV